MIRNQDELTIIREQLTRVEDGLAALREEVLPINPDNFEILAEGYVVMIKSLRTEIDEYLGLVPVHVDPLMTPLHLSSQIG